MDYSNKDIAAQKELAKQYGSKFCISELNDKVGLSYKTISKQPLNGLRHKPENGTSGWYFWGGSELDSDPNFFDPTHLSHAVEQYPDIIPFLGLEPGWRLIYDSQSGYTDVLFDPNLT